MSNEEAWEKFIETGRVDFYLLSRGIDIYAEGYLPRPKNDIFMSAETTGGDGNESGGFGNGAECHRIG